MAQSHRVSEEAHRLSSVVSVPDLRAFIARVLQTVGLPEPDADRVATLMAEADARGADGHGVFRLPQYVKRIQSGGINTKPNMRIVREQSATALVDGDNAMGHLVMSRAAEIAIDKARSAGVAWVGARNSNHAGPAMLYARKPLAHDMIGIYIAVGSANHLPPWGGIAMLLSTNPIAIAVPGFQKPAIVLDMATTNAAYGKVKIKAQRNEPMPEGWMLDRQGQPLTDPKRAAEGFLLPIGGPKGYGLALMFGLLAGTLNGAAFGKDVVDFNADDTSETNTGHFMVAIDVARFLPLATFKKEVDRHVRDFRASNRLPGVDAIRLPGDRRRECRAERLRDGVPIAAPLLAQLDRLAAELTVTPLRGR